MKSVCIANAGDFDRMGRWQDRRLWSAMRRNAGRSLRRFGLKAIPGSWALADMALFWSRSDCLVLAPPVLDPALIAYSDILMGRSRTKFVPIAVDAGMAAAAAGDSNIVRQIISHLDGNEGELHAWGATEDIYDLVETVRSAGGRLFLSEAPAKQNFGLVQEFDSKTGFRRLVSELQAHSVHVGMPEGFICSSRQQVAERTADLLRSGSDCVVKSNFGSGGFGVLTVRVSPDQTITSAIARLAKAMDKRPSAFRTGPYVVERRISYPAGNDRAIGATSVLAFIDVKATVRITGWAREIRDTANNHVGAGLGKGIDDDGIKAELVGQTLALAEQAAAMGYRGFFGVDFLVDAFGSTFAIEINPRRCCSESTTYDIGEALYGPGWDERKAALLRLPLPLRPGKLPSSAAILETLQSANQELGPDAQIVPLSLSWLKHARPGIGYVLFAPDMSEIETAEKLVAKHLRLAGVEPMAPAACRGDA